MEYNEMMRRLQGEKGSPFIINAILAQEDERATYTDIESYTDDDREILPEDQLTSRIDTLVAFGLIAPDEDVRIGEENQNQDIHYTLTETGEEFLREDLSDFESYRRMLKQTR